MSQGDTSTPHEPLTRDQLIEWFVDAERPGGHLIGTEQEKFGVVVGEPGTAPRPATWKEHVEPLLRGLMDRFGWEPAKDRGTGGEIVALRRDGASITLEPGGQVELSGAPLPTVHDTCAEFTTHYRELHAVAEPLGLAYIATGFHPFATRDEIDWMPKGRYVVMREYLPTRGKLALDMMTRTCTVQANFDFGSEAEARWRLKVAMSLAAPIAALFANAPYKEGRHEGVRSQRSAVWEAVDPDRCGYLDFILDGSFSYERYADWALDVPMFFVKRDRGYIAHHGTFRDYMAKGFEDDQHVHQWATTDDLKLHFNTLFPEARLNPFIEVRSPDSVGSRFLCALPALTKGLLYDEAAGREALALVDGLDMQGFHDLWVECRTAGMTSPRVRAMGLRLLELSRQALDAMDVRDSKGRTEARFLDPLQALAEQGKSPADLRLDELGSNPGTDDKGRRSLVKAFHFAGAGGPDSQDEPDA